MPHKKTTDALSDYRKKRAADSTPEPFGGRGGARPGLFVVQKHSARRLHYDLRLEMDGVLRSWAVPKGPSLDPKEKRLAVLTEDHPLEYGDWEGVIPADNYGAGAVILWDRGPAIHHLDPVAGTLEGKLLFELKGFKLRGLWTLVKTSRADKEWLLIKKPDAEATGEDAGELDPHSVMSGLTVDEMRDGSNRAAEVRSRLLALGAPAKAVAAESVKPMLATLESDPFSRSGWFFELKYDGYRLLAERHGRSASGDAEARLRYRSGLDATSIYPDIELAMRALPYEGLILDGEIVVLDDAGKPSFQLLQQRARLSRPLDVDHAAARSPATYFVFDLLAFEDFDVRPLALGDRKTLLRQLLPPRGPIRYADHVAERGREFYDQIRQLGLEGMVAKRAAAPYRAGRSPDWVKIRAELSGDFAVVGYTKPKGSRAGFGALHLAALDAAGAMRYAGRVGTGFSGQQLDALRARLEPFRRPQPACVGAPSKGAEHRWVEPQLVAEVRYTEFTRDGHLRHPVFVRLREDKSVAECERDDEPPTPQVEQTAAAAPPLKVPISRPEKLFWPEEGITKGDLIGYYRAVAPSLLPFLRDRPLVLDRYPDGYRGKSFFQKNAPAFAPDWVRTEAVWSGDADKETTYFICDSIEMITYLVNSGAIPFHIWSSRLPSLQSPDWCILDLDAKDADFGDVVTIARAIHRLCRDIGLPTAVKTSGATGMHVLIPLGGLCTHDQSKQLALLLAQHVSQQLPDIASVARSPGRRQGLVYIDAIQNGYGKLLVAPYSVRPRPGAPVSTPLHWREVNSKLDPAAFTVRTVPPRLERQRRDPWRDVLSQRPDLPGALARLAERL
jgi:bifunctional non-homologous end joining protein LigD